MTTKILDDNICTFKSSLSWRFPRKSSVFGRYSPVPPNPPPPFKNAKFDFYCRLAISDYMVRQSKALTFSKQGSTPTPWAVCETKYKNGRSIPRKPFISRVCCAQRAFLPHGLRPWSRKGPDHGVGVDPEIALTLRSLRCRPYSAVRSRVIGPAPRLAPLLLLAWEAAAMPAERPRLPA